MTKTKIKQVDIKDLIIKIFILVIYCILFVNYIYLGSKIGFTKENYAESTQIIIEIFSWFYIVYNLLYPFWVDKRREKFVDKCKIKEFASELNKMEGDKYTKGLFLIIIVILLVFGIFYFSLINKLSYIPLGSLQLPVFSDTRLYAGLYFINLGFMLTMGIYIQYYAFQSYCKMLNGLDKNIKQPNIKISFIKGGVANEYLEINDKLTEILLIPIGFLLVVASYFGIIKNSNEAGYVYSIYAIILFVAIIWKNIHIERNIKEKISEALNRMNKIGLNELDHILENINTKLKKGNLDIGKELDQAKKMSELSTFFKPEIRKNGVTYRSYLYVFSITSTLLITLNIFIDDRILLRSILEFRKY